MSWRRAGRYLFGVAALALVSCSNSNAPEPGEGESDVRSEVTPESVSGEPIAPLKALAKEKPALVDLGRRLFFDTILSKDGRVACSNCHDIANGGDDGRVVSVGVDGKIGEVNSPTVFNAALNVAQFWDGRADTLEAQIDGPLQHRSEMGSNWEEVEAKLQKRPDLLSAFQAAGLKPARDGVKKSIAAYERTLITVDSPFDRWLLGDKQALGKDALEGYELFKSAGCIACHQGQNAGGNMYQRFGVFGDYFKDRGNITKADNGRFNVTGKEVDRHVFRVPSLRNVELTAPYFHDGSAKTLPDAVKVMLKYQLGKELPEDQVAKLVSFLKSLTGKQGFPGKTKGGDRT